MKVILGRNYEINYKNNLPKKDFREIKEVFGIRNKSLEFSMMLLGIMQFFHF
jgi:hypothetical protein